MMEEDEFDQFLGYGASNDEAPAQQGTPCRLVGRFAPIQGVAMVDCTAVTFRSTPGLRQLSVFVTIPTRSILACTTEGCAVSLAVQGMAGRGVSFEFNSAAQCCEVALSLATAGQQSEEELDTLAEEDVGLEGGCSAVLDEVVLNRRFSFVLKDCRLMAWERCACIPVAHSSPGSLQAADSTCSTGAEVGIDSSSARATEDRVPGILYVCEGGLIFLPDRYCKCSSEASLRRVATILAKAKCHSVRQILGGLQVRGAWIGRRPNTGAQSGWAFGDGRACQREGDHDQVLGFELGLSKDFEALSHAAYGLMQDTASVERSELRDAGYKGNEAERARGKVWAKTYANLTGHQIRADPGVRCAILGGDDGTGSALPAGVPASCRAMIWFKLSGAEELRAAHEPQYAYNLLNCPLPGSQRCPNGSNKTWAPGGRVDGQGDREVEELMAKAEVEINKDIHRTFSDKEIRECLGAVGLDRDIPLQWFGNKLKRVLMAYARHNPSIGYCQSLNYLGGLLVIVLDAEEECFWVLSALVQLCLPKGYYADLSGVQIDVQVLSYLLEQNLKPVKEKLELVHLPLSSFATQWLMCAYVNVLPLPSVLKVWDTLILLGPVVLFRVALALLKAIEGELGLATEMEDAMAALQRARSLEIETVLTIARVCFGEDVVDVSALMHLRAKANSVALSS